MITAEFFDNGRSPASFRGAPPQAAALVAQLADPERAWDAVAIGEYERAFYGSQYASMAPLFEHYGIPLWTPEVGGRIDFHAEDHEQTMLALGLSVQAGDRPDPGPGPRRDGGPDPRAGPLSGRPPAVREPADGRRAAPEQGACVVGRRAHRLEPDPATAPIVRWMFAQRLAGHTAARITCALNDAGSAVPVRCRPGRNLHRSGTPWTLRTVAATLANPRYTGRQVWNRQPTESVLVDPADTGLGHRQVQRWNLPEGWVISRHPAHTTLVSEADFIAAQDAAVPARPGRPRHPPVPASRAHRLRPVRASVPIILVQRQAAYRCRHGYASAARPGSRPAEEHLYPRGPHPPAPSCCVRPGERR